MPIRGGNDHGGTLGKRPVQLPHVHIEEMGSCAERGHPPYRNLVLLPAQAVINRAVADGSALGLPVRAGSEST